MKRHELDPLNMSLLKSLDEFARSNGLSITDIAAREGLLDAARDSLEQHVVHEARIHGFRVESMFAHVAAAMGETILVSEEDAGALFDETGTLKRPDFRVITRDGEQMLVEVKNFHPKGSPTKPYRRIKGNYLASLKRYAQINDVPLRIAIYWSRWNLWSLLDAKRLDESQQTVTITMEDAFLHNELYLLGDRMIGTLPPLSFRLYADKAKPRGISPDGEAGFTVAKACICCDDTDVDDAEERRIAWYLMLNGTWNEIEQIAEINDGLVDYVEMRVSPSDPPEEESDDQPFRSLGYLSQMVTSQYLRSTSDDGDITSLSPKTHPDRFRLRISQEYKGSALKLWQFTMLPKDADLSAIKNAT